MASFRKRDRLTDKKAISLLFSREVASKKYFPILVLSSPFDFDRGSDVQVLISVPKRRVRKAVERNLIKRRIRSAYAQIKAELQDGAVNSLALGFVYLANEPMPYSKIEQALIKFRDDVVSTIQ